MQYQCGSSMFEYVLYLSKEALLVGSIGILCNSDELQPGTVFD